MQKGEIIAEPTVNQAVKDIFKLYLDGKSMSEIARQMSISQISDGIFSIFFIGSIFLKLKEML